MNKINFFQDEVTHVVEYDLTQNTGNDYEGVIYPCENLTSEEHTFFISNKGVIDVTHIVNSSELPLVMGIISEIMNEHGITSDDRCS